MLLSVLIPARNEEKNLEKTIVAFSTALSKEKIPYQILVVNDNSNDNTVELLERLIKKISNLRYVNNLPPNGFGRAVKKGLNEFKGDVVAIVMADGSDLPGDLVKFYKKILEGYDCVFGSRFSDGGRVVDYPKLKFILNRMGNFLIKKVFKLEYNDITNAFKCYRRSVIDSAKPILSNNFNLTIELPIKAIIYGYSYTVVPNSWLNRKQGVSKLKLKKMCAQYLMTILFLIIYRYFVKENNK